MQNQQPSPMYPLYQQPPPPQFAQNQQSSTTVIINQPQVDNTLLHGTVKGHRGWSTGLFDCFDDMGMCCFTAFCYGYAVGQLAIRTGECACTPCYVPGSEITIRTRIRTLGGIQGSMCDDCLVVTFCGQCAACQEAQELTNMGIP